MAAAPSAMGPAYMTPSMPIKSGKMTMSGSRNKIWRVRDMNTPRRALPIELKKLEGDRLDAVDQRQEHINAEVPLRKLVVHLAAGAENTDDLPREKLEAGKRCQRKPGSHSQRQQIALLTRR